MAGADGRVIPVGDPVDKPVHSPCVVLCNIHSASYVDGSGGNACISRWNAVEKWQPVGESNPSFQVENLTS